MGELILTDFDQEAKVSWEPAENQEAQEQKNSTYQNRKVLVSILILQFVLPEMLIYSGKIGDAISMYAGILAVLSLIPIFIKDQEILNICQALLLLPILRIINFSMPIFSESPLLSFEFIYAPMIIPVAIVLMKQHFTDKQIGMNFKNIRYYLPASIFIGLILGQGEYSCIQTIQLIPDISFINILKLTFVMVFFVGIIEEIIFRSILQTRFEEIFGRGGGLILASLLFGVMNSSYGNLQEIIYVSLVGLLIGYTFQKTRSLPLISMVHGFINVFSLGVIPHLGPGFGLF